MRVEAEREWRVPTISGDGEGGDGVGERAATPQACKAAGGDGGGSVAGA